MKIKVGTKFKSKSKIQDQPIGYMFNGKTKSGDYHLIALSGNKIEDVEVDKKWFENREIKIKDK